MSKSSHLTLFVEVTVRDHGPTIRQARTFFYLVINESLIHNGAGPDAVAKGDESDDDVVSVVIIIVARTTQIN
jgi:hypothetical protein